MKSGVDGRSSRSVALYVKHKDAKEVVAYYPCLW